MKPSAEVVRLNHMMEAFIRKLNRLRTRRCRDIVAVPCFSISLRDRVLPWTWRKRSLKTGTRFFAFGALYLAVMVDY